MINVKKMTLEQMEERVDNVLMSLHRVTRKIDEAKITAAATGVYSDTEWFIKATAAKRAKALEHQLLLKEIAARKREKRRENNDSLERLFIDVARDRLPYDIFMGIVAAANREFADSSRGNK